jgi:hypothetical protein
MERMHQTSFSDEMDLRTNAPAQMVIKTWQNMQLRRDVLSSFRDSDETFNNASFQRRKTDVLQRQRQLTGATPLSLRYLAPPSSSDTYGATS